MLETYGSSALSKVRRVLRGNLWGMVTAILVASLALPPETTAQAPVAPPAAGQPPQAPNLAPQTPAPLPVESLGIYVLEGQNEMHDIRNRVTATPVVEVRDDNGQPVEGADVTFELPPMGPSGAFAGQALTYTGKTNEQGQVAASFLPNLQAGRFTIRVTAKSANRTGHATITQTNALRAGTAEPKGGLFKFAWWKVAVLGGVAATVAILVTRGGSGNSVTLIPGTPTFGAP